MLSSSRSGRTWMSISLSGGKKMRNKENKKTSMRGEISKYKLISYLPINCVKYLSSG